MIQVLLSWAVDHWQVFESRIALLTIARVDGPISVLGLDARIFMQLLEGVVREDPDRARRLDDVYSSAAQAAEEPAVPDRASRRRDIDRLTRLFGG